MAEKKDEIAETVNHFLTKEASNRFNRLLEFNKEHANKIKTHIYNLYRSNKIKNLITEEEFAEIAKSTKIEKATLKVDRKKSSFLDF